MIILLIDVHPTPKQTPRQALAAAVRKAIAQTKGRVKPGRYEVVIRAMAEGTNGN
jgi:hypothetical protein